ncbi:CheR family methyltransferase [Rhodopila globiformis]|uniref:Chemotaxis protein methyltransferase n=1 Tax=Rhodopila globiformis TaxID=1071 RepID=A0A2S6N3X0_RHOGL|nr:protein-glutamate O-methyltransferase CheR [Rhodopila globiformis]PPQ29302.1 chemotaxis protein CheR [Rhodopila globiformis]
MTQAPLPPANLQFDLAREEFVQIAAMLRQETGISLANSKMDLVQGRLARRLRALGLGNFAQYLEIVTDPEAADERRQMVNALTTNLTGFFREAHHFDYLGDTILPEIARTRPAGSSRLRIWSAGCSSGEEPYSIAMTVCAKLPDWQCWDARVLATDIDTNMVATGRAGQYEASRAGTVPESYRKRFLLRLDSGTVQVAEVLRDLVAFRQLNLLGAWPMRGRFNVIFCRNVVIYFDKPTQRTLFDRFADILAPGGWLIVGHSETLFRLSDRFEALGRTIYRKTA